MGRVVLATKDQLAGFHKRIIEGDLPKEIDDAQKELDDAKLKLKAAVLVAHAIMKSYMQTPKLSAKFEPREKVAEILRRQSWVGDGDFWKYCNGFLKDFCLRIATESRNKYYSPDLPVQVELELLSE